ncbi:hypothetical protein BH20ACT13_BH20ACT13_25690 [soil metagenome]
MARAILGFALIMGILTGAGAPAARSTHSASSYFVTPSRNILCLWSATVDARPRTFLRCQIGTGLNPRPKRPPDCDTDWGFGLTLLNVGRAEVLCAGDTIWRRWKPVLTYGTTWRKRGFTCRSAFVGLTCRNTDGHGFFLSRERWRRL